MANRAEVLDAIDGSFSEPDLQELCFLLGIDYANLAGSTKRAKVQSLILYHEHRQDMPALAAAVIRERPFLQPIFQAWLTPPAATPRIAAADALRQLLAEGGTFNKAQTDTLNHTLAKLKSTAGKGHPPDADAARAVADLIAAAGLSPADQRRAERLLHELG